MRVARHVDQQIAQHAIDEPRRHVLARAQRVAAKLGERDIEFVDLIVARLVDARRLARRADEEPREQVGQRRMIVPIRDQAREQIGTAQERAVGGRRAAEHEVIAAARADMPAVDHELLARQPRSIRGVVQEFGVLNELVEIVRGMDVYFDHTGIGCHLQHLQPRVARRRVAFEHELRVERFGGQLDRGQQVEIVFERGDRRHEHVEHAAACLDAQRGARDPPGGLEALREARGLGLARRPRERAFAGARLHHGPRGRVGVARRRARIARCAEAAADMARAQRIRIGQRVARRERIKLDEIWIVAAARPRQRIERQAIAHRRIARHEIHPLIAEEPRARLPARPRERRIRRERLERQHVADHAVQLLREHLAQTRTLELVVEPRVERIDVHG